MVEYITAQQVSDLLGSDWAGDADPTQAVLEANVWLSARDLPHDPTPELVARAGALLAREAAHDRLYVDSTGSVKRERVSAGRVSSETEYVGGANPKSGTMRLILDLLRPWMSSGSTFEVRRA